MVGVCINPYMYIHSIQSVQTLQPISFVIKHFGEICYPGKLNIFIFIIKKGESIKLNAERMTRFGGLNGGTVQWYGIWFDAGGCYMQIPNSILNYYFFVWNEFFLPLK